MTRPTPAGVPGVDQSLLERILEESPIGMAVIDIDGIYRIVNPAYGALYGYAPSELVGRSFTTVFPEGQRARALAMHQAFLADGGAFRGETDVLRRDGQIFSVLAESVRVPGRDGRGERLVYVVDISQRKRSEQALQSSQQFLHSVLDGLTSQVCVLDEAGVIMAVNRAWRDFAAANAGLSNRVHEGANYLAECERASHEFAAGESPEGSPFVQQLRQVLAGQRTGFQFEYPCHSPTEQRWFLARVSRIEGSQPLRVVVAHDNVTALKQAQETLRESEALLLDLAASIPGAMFRLVNSAAGRWRFVYFSPGLEALFELAPAQACGDIHTLTRHILAEDRPAHDQSIREAVASGRVWEHEYRIRTPSGRLKWVQAKASPKPGPDGSTVWTGVLTDVSERKHMESVLKASEEKYRTLFETVPQGVVYQDASGRITSANPAAQRILGLTLEQMQGLQSIDSRWEALHEDGSPFPGEQHPSMVALRTGQPVNNVVMGISVPDRGHAWLLINATPLVRQGVVQEVYASFEDITERVLMSRELHLQANTDYLTGVANRRGLMERLQLEFKRMQQQPSRRCAVLAADLDHFKRINDSWGHAVGDAVLQHVARLMQQLTRQRDLVARSGGEEFTLLLPEVGADEALALAERLRQHLQATPLLHQGQPLPVTLSIGVSPMSATDAAAEVALLRADQALYQAKAGGRNLVRLAPVSR
ncbi:MAG: PAS domain S-box protein [Aquabacterium sp.]|nr:PAS domain S-box protein [Aquabacterium sp.]